MQRALLVHLVLFFVVELAIFIGARILVLLVLRYKIVHVALCLCEFHFVHALPGVPMQKGFPSEHGCELFAHSLEHLLQAGRQAGRQANILLIH